MVDDVVKRKIWYISECCFVHRNNLSVIENVGKKELKT